jgi:hypothetical protein
VQTVVELTLERPLELWMVEIAWMHLEVVSVHRDVRILELDDDFHPIIFVASAEFEQRMLVETQLSEHTSQAAVRITCHFLIVLVCSIFGTDVRFPRWQLRKDVYSAATILPQTPGNFMSSIHQLFYWEGLILLVGFFGIVCWKLLTGAIDLQYLLYGDARTSDGSRSYTFFSPGRAQLLMLTVTTSVYLLLQVIHDPATFPKVPEVLLAALGGSQALYLGGKAQALLWGRARDFLNRRTP